ncbi:TIGR02285 family protein [Roseateles chitosanitabidus]|uniref:TIGR02285 family protein n=1 Tax=Roseateles chitosanitabidus TaxID=65048 RepID=UPI000830EA3A|nr:TIGR02285 family protein [Roseateles chitosanitabidus]MBO9686491.1 TIGR02285 family protein [Roseateles chitosanitabidus]
MARALVAIGSCLATALAGAQAAPASPSAGSVEPVAEGAVPAPTTWSVAQIGTPPTAPTGAPAGGTGARPVLRWLVQDIPPHFSYRDGKPPQRPEDLGQGEVDGFLRVLTERLPQYRHEFVELSLPRFEAQARAGETLCSLLHVRTPERLQWLYFTPLHPPLLTRQVHVILRREDLSRFEPNGQALQLADLLRRKDLVGLVPRDRSFGPRIDKLLSADPDQAPRSVVAGRSANLLGMLKARRMDWTLDYPATVEQYSQQHPGSPELMRLPLAEGRSTMVATGSCSRTPTGRRAIEAIDQAVRQIAAEPLPQRDALIRAWRGPAGIEAEDLKAINRYFDERARGPAQIE